MALSQKYLLDDMCRFNLEAFLPYVCECVKATDLLVHLPVKYFSKEHRKEIFRLCGKSNLVAMQYAVNVLINENKEPGRFVAFRDAIHKSKYPKIVQMLDGEVIPSDDNCKKIINLFAEEIVKQLDPEELLPSLVRKDTITCNDAENIRAEERNHGKRRACWVLLYHLPNRVKNWFRDLIETLIDRNYGDIAKLLDPDLFNSLSIEKQRCDKKSSQPIVKEKQRAVVNGDLSKFLKEEDDEVLEKNTLKTSNATIVKGLPAMNCQIDSLLKDFGGRTDSDGTVCKQLMAEDIANDNLRGRESEEITLDPDTRNRPERTNARPGKHMKYGRDFLLACRNLPLALVFPKDIENVPEIMLPVIRPKEFGKNSRVDNKKKGRTNIKTNEQSLKGIEGMKRNQPNSEDAMVMDGMLETLTESSLSGELTGNTSQKFDNKDTEIKSAQQISEDQEMEGYRDIVKNYENRNTENVDQSLEGIGTEALIQDNCSASSRETVEKEEITVNGGIFGLGVVTDKQKINGIEFTVKDIIKENEEVNLKSNKDSGQLPGLDVEMNEICKDNQDLVKQIVQILDDDVQNEVNENNESSKEMNEMCKDNPDLVKQIVQILDEDVENEEIENNESSKEMNEICKDNPDLVKQIVQILDDDVQNEVNENNESSKEMNEMCRDNPDLVKQIVQILDEDVENEEIENNESSKEMNEICKDNPDLVKQIVQILDDDVQNEVSENNESSKEMNEMCRDNPDLVKQIVQILDDNADDDDYVNEINDNTNTLNAGCVEIAETKTSVDKEVWRKDIEDPVEEHIGEDCQDLNHSIEEKLETRAKNVELEFGPSTEENFDKIAENSLSQITYTTEVPFELESVESGNNSIGANHLQLQDSDLHEDVPYDEDIDFSAILLTEVEGDKEVLNTNESNKNELTFELEELALANEMIEKDAEADDAEGNSANKITNDASDGMTKGSYEITNGAHELANGALLVINDIHKVSNEAHDVSNDALEVPDEAHEVADNAHEVADDAYDITNDAHEVLSDTHEVLNDAHVVLYDALEVSNDVPEVANGAQEDTNDAILNFDFLLNEDKYVELQEYEVDGAKPAIRQAEGENTNEIFYDVPDENDETEDKVMNVAEGATGGHDSVLTEEDILAMESMVVNDLDFFDAQEYIQDLDFTIQAEPDTDNLSDVDADDDDIPLREYQKELAKDGCEGKNVVVMAPTNTGKTRVACRIMQVHLRAQRRAGKIGKVIFLVENEALALQQGNVCAELLPAYRTMVISGSIQRDKKQLLKDFVARRDVLVVTAQILLNDMKNEEIDSLAIFSMVVFDECHHTDNAHRFNEIMSRYMDLKLRYNYAADQLPQIVGLTASLGVGGNVEIVPATAHMKGLLANHDAQRLCTVRRNIEELRHYENNPIEEIAAARRRRNDRYKNAIVNIMDMIDDYMINHPSVQDLPNYDAFIKTKCRVPACKGTEEFRQWLSEFKKDLGKLHSDTVRRMMNPCRIHLEKYNKALLIHADARIKDGARILEEYMEEFRVIIPKDETDLMLLELYDNLMAMDFSDEPENPKLLMMERIVMDILGGNEDARGIVFVKTRELAVALVAWMKETAPLNTLAATEFVGQVASKAEGGMTKCGQKDALEYFKGGRHKIIVATSVAEEGLDITKCNLVVRYEHVTNEIVRLQSRGRARQQNSRYYVLTEEGSPIVAKEEKNALLERVMNIVVAQLQAYIEDHPLLWERERREIQEKQKEEEELKNAQRLANLTENEQEFQCLNCSKFICYLSDIRKIQGAHHVAVGEEVPGRVVSVRSPRPEYMEDDLVFDGGIFCGNRDCQYELGGVCEYKKAEFPLLKIKQFRIVDVQSGAGGTYKKWKKANFEVEEFTLEDLREVAERKLAALTRRI